MPFRQPGRVRETLPPTGAVPESRVTRYSLEMAWTRPWRWAAESNERAVANARAAAVMGSRRLVEQADAAAYLERVEEQRRTRPA